ncbi:MAG: YesL family protein [Lachnospiraceae bacterium]|nr:YesL family protein [Lachnospiraceae bacterium]
MLERIFDADNVVFRFLGTVGYIWWLHILWLLCSLPLITVGASTTALIYSCMKLHNKEGYATRNFFRSFRENFIQSTILYVIFLIIGGLLLMDLILSGYTASGLGRFVRYGAIALLIPYAMTLLYTFAVQAKFVNPVAKTLRYAFGLSIKYFKYTIQMICVAAIALCLNMTIVLANFITLSVGVGIVVYIFSLYYNKIFSEILERQGMEDSGLS